MNKYRRLLICPIVMLIIALAGCQLALEDQGANNCEDRLVGMLVTTESLDLFDMESYLKDNIGSISGGDITIDCNAKEYQGRLYAKLIKKTMTNEETGEASETDQYVFESVRGISFFTARVPDTTEHGGYHTTSGDDSISDCHTSIGVGDKENSLALEGTVFVSPRGSQSTFFLNPVYQSADGRVYATSGSGISCSSDGQAEGITATQTMSSSRVGTENGKAVKDSTSLKLTISVMNTPNRIAVLQMDDTAAVVSRVEYAPGTLPKAISPERNTAYIVVETHKTDWEGKAQVTRTLYGKDTQSLDTFLCREDGVCVKRWTQLNWAK